MVKITIGIEGMACGMCEAHLGEAVRNAFQVKKVTSSHMKMQTEVFRGIRIPFLGTTLGSACVVFMKKMRG